MIVDNTHFDWVQKAKFCSDSNVLQGAEKNMCIEQWLLYVSDFFTIYVARKSELLPNISGQISQACGLNTIVYLNNLTCISDIEKLQY